MKNSIIDSSKNFGRFFEDFEVGSIIKHWPGKTITEYDCHLFSLLTMNQHPLHIDAHFASKSQHKQILVVGTYVFSLVVGQSVRDISGKAIANLEYESVVHNAPVFIGDTIYSETEVLEKRESRSKADRAIVYVETRANNQKGEKVLTLRRRVLIPKRGYEDDK
ncbi:MAG: MaoC family dehydratase [Promethearchaeota archaeon]|jgi:acyl dehydratase